MAKTVVAMFDNVQDARNAVSDLIDNGFSRDDISLVARGDEDEIRRYEAGGTAEGEDLSEGIGIGALIGGLLGLGAMFIPGIGPVLAAGPLVTALAGAGVGAVAGGLIGALVDAGIPDEDAEVYAEGVRRGGTLLTVNATDQMASRAVDIMNGYNPVDIERRSQTWRDEHQWSGFDPNAEPYAGQEMHTQQTMGRTDRDMDMPDRDFTHEESDTLPVAEEELRVGKREVSTGGMRVHTDVVEEPVEEDITLRQEHVDVERRPVDRPVDEMDDVFKEGTIEMHGKAEEAVTDKQAHITEEVELRKDVSEHTETIRDTLRHTEVNIEEIEPEIEQGYERHFGTMYGETGRDYEYYQPAYRYGYALRSSGRYSNFQWNDVEPELRRDWERRNPDSAWDDIKDAVREGWNSIT